MRARPSMASERSCKIAGSSLYINNDLRITFRRTIRVPDNGQELLLPPDLGKFSPREVSDHANKFLEDVAEKGGIFMSMYR
ncbi:hypothetical protein BCR34DRAFT_574357 [Clohesyomyces aquaticus]|uniref:Uncharacterized protein n=1 Tax=Clohesyomyces aquaticus TaxID=1231657 RepID=A0A1Y1YX79_9PLEO|nr:hypothetical protein BCR34DRAFT_574357 [Clohesyomyces aquaticus]